MSVGANYRAACRARSRADFIAKMKIVEEEADESAYWPELLLESGLVPADRVADQLREANEIVAIVVASIRTARKNERKERCSSVVTRNSYFATQHVLSWFRQKIQTSSRMMRMMTRIEGVP